MDDQCHYDPAFWTKPGGTPAIFPLGVRALAWKQLHGALQEGFVPEDESSTAVALTLTSTDREQRTMDVYRQVKALQRDKRGTSTIRIRIPDTPELEGGWFGQEPV